MNVSSSIICIDESNAELENCISNVLTGYN